MSSSAYAAPLRLELRRSRRLAIYLAVAHLGALALIPALPLAVPLAWLLAALVLLCLLRSYAGRVLLRGGRDIVALVWERGGEWRLCERSGSERVCRLRPDSYVHPLLTVLNFAGERRGSVVLLPDSLDADTFRRLRVRLSLDGVGQDAPDHPA